MYVSFFFLCIPPGVSWLGLERIVIGMRSDWARQWSFFWLVVYPGASTLGVALNQCISVTPAPFLFCFFSSLSPSLYLTECRWLCVWCECVWRAKTEPAVGCSVFLLSQRCSVVERVAHSNYRCAKWSFAMCLIKTELLCWFTDLEVGFKAEYYLEFFDTCMNTLSELMYQYSKSF